MGGHRVQGRLQEEAKAIEQSALDLEDAGAFSIVLEGIPHELAKRISKSLSIPTIGIGAGADCSGQVLVVHDVLGLTADSEGNFPKFVKNYSNLTDVILEAVGKYSEEVKSSKFPEEKHSYSSSGPRLVKSRSE
jgi:3-methyl-2-oxobutanoate hydroxymethyltransferase